MIKALATLATMAAIATGFAAPAAHADPPIACTTQPGGAPIATPECNSCIMAHLFDREGLFHACLGGNPGPVPPGLAVIPNP
jgi:hypothetical protein